MPPTQSWTLVLDIFHHYRVGKKHKMWHVRCQKRKESLMENQVPLSPLYGKWIPTFLLFWKIENVWGQPLWRINIVETS